MFNQFLGEEGIKRVLKWASISLLFFSIFLLVKIIGDLKRLPNAGKEIYPQSTVTVSGRGETYAIPDIASFNFSIIENGATVAAAQEKVEGKLSKSLDAIKQSGIEDKDIQTISYNVNPKYEWEQVMCITYPCPIGKNRLTGYEVSQTIVVKVRDIEKAGDLVTKVGAIGVSNISGLEFKVDDREKYVAEARKIAIEQAKDNAKKLAKQLGVRLGKIVYYTDNSGYMPYYGEGMGGGDMMKSATVSSSATLPAGESKIESNISITYEIR